MRLPPQHIDGRCPMKWTKIALILILLAMSMGSVGAMEPSVAAAQRTIKLQAYARKPDPSPPHWSRLSKGTINSTFHYCCAAGATDSDLDLEVPKEMAWLFKPATTRDFAKPKVGSCPKSMSYPSLNLWRHHLLFALQQLKWELATDPAHQPRKLGPYYNGELQWNQTSTARKLAEIWYDNKPVKLSGVLQVPALSYKAYFQGTAKFLLVFHRGRKVEVRMLDSTLPVPVNSRIAESLRSLNGHPVAEFPEADVEVGQIPLVCNFYFRDEPQLKKPPAGAWVFGLATTEYYD